jgi:c-di-GMP-binding flagellar brake protein YcgR
MEASLSSNRRHSSRRPLRLLCEAVRERDFKRVSTVLLDLSSSGALLRATSPVLTGDAMIVSFFEPESARWFDVEATVARVVHGRRVDDGERAIGVRFEGMSISDQRMLERALCGRMPALPKRRKALGGRSSCG